MTLRTILIIFLSLFLSLTNVSFSQKKDSLKGFQPLKATANLNINTNGISLFPNLSYGKPAAIINVSLGKRNVFFEPELRWGLDGKPWSYIYWLRYKYRKQKFGFNIGGHPAYNIRPFDVTINGQTDYRYIARRNIAGEIVPSIYFSKIFYLSVQYLRSKGSDKNYGTQKSEFISLQPRFPNIKISKNYYMTFYPQIFHLTIDETSGYYVNESLSLNRKDFPVNISSIFTYKIKSTIPGDNIVWNVGVNYKL